MRCLRQIKNISRSFSQGDEKNQARRKDMKKIVLAVDGGNSKTHYALFDLQGNLVDFLERGTASHERMPDGYEGMKNELKRSLDMLLGRNGFKAGDIDFCVFGLAGADIPEQYGEIEKRIEEIGFRRFKVYNDAFLGIKAGSLKGFGVCSINGTGTCCVAIDRKGSRVQVGGIGHSFGDDAGAGYIESMVIRRVYEYFFRCGPKTLMSEMLFKELGISDENLIVETVKKRMRDKNTKRGSLCKIAFEAANLGDKVATELLGYVGGVLARAVGGAVKRLDFSGETEIDVVMAGSVYVKGENPALINAFKEEANCLLGGRANYVLLREPPVSGAALWALEELNCCSEAARNNVLDSLKKLFLRLET